MNTYDCNADFALGEAIGLVSIAKGDLLETQADQCLRSQLEPLTAASGKPLCSSVCFWGPETCTALSDLLPIGDIPLVPCSQLQ